MRRSPGLAAGPAAVRCPAGRVLEGRGPQRLAHCGLHGVELVVAGDLLLQAPAAVVLEHDEVPHQVEEPPVIAHPLHQHLELRQRQVCELLAGDGAPRLEPLAARGQRPEPGLQPVGHHHRRIHREQPRQVVLVGLELVPRRPDGGVGVGRVLEFDHPERQPVDEQHDVGAPFGLVLNDGELVDCQPVVVGGVVEVDHPSLRAPDPRAVAVLDVHAFHHHAVEGPVAGLHGRSLRAGQAPNCIAQRLGGQPRIEPCQRIPQCRGQHHGAVVGSLRRSRLRVDLRPMGDGPAQFAEPAERSGLDVGLGEPGHAARARPARAQRAAEVRMRTIVRRLALAES